MLQCVSSGMSISEGVTLTALESKMSLTSSVLGQFSVSSLRERKKKKKEPGFSACDSAFQLKKLYF